MNHRLWALAACSLVLIGANAGAQESPKVQITVKVPAKTPSFKDQRLVAALAHNFPDQADRGNRTVDRHINGKFSHTKGKDTVLTFTLGDNVKVTPGVAYFVTLTVFDAASKRTYHGELNDRPGPFYISGLDAPKKLTLTVAPAP